VTIKEQLEFIRDSLRATWAKEAKARVEVSEALGTVLDRLMNPPGGATVDVMFEREEPLEEETPENDAVERRYLLVIGRGKGMALMPGSNLLVPQAGAPALLDSLEGLRDAVRGLEFASTDVSEGEEVPDELEVHPCYLGTRAWRGTARWPVDAMEMEFSICSRI
jgi:hypothetical protein